jgi:hypothetical protein
VDTSARGHLPDVDSDVVGDALDEALAHGEQRAVGTPRQRGHRALRWHQAVRERAGLEVPDADGALEQSAGGEELAVRADGDRGHVAGVLEGPADAQSRLRVRGDEPPGISGEGRQRARAEDRHRRDEPQQGESEEAHAEPFWPGRDAIHVRRSRFARRHRDFDVAC